MGFIRGMLFGILVCAAIRQITKKNKLTGTSELDLALEKAPGYIEGVKNVIGQVATEIDTIVYKTKDFDPGPSVATHQPET